MSTQNFIADNQLATMDEPTWTEILDELLMRERRLGRPEELPDDYHRVCTLAHLLRNRLTVKMLAAEIIDRGLQSR